MAGMVTRRDTAAAVAMGVVIRSLGREGSIRFAAYRHKCGNCGIIAGKIEYREIFIRKLYLRLVNGF